MKDTNSIELIRTLLEEQLFGCLATAQEGAPYTSLVAFSASSDLSRIFVATERATRKYTNLVSNGRVSFLVSNAANTYEDVSSAAAVTVQGSILELEGAEREEHLQGYVSKHPQLKAFVESPSCALISIQVEKYFLVTSFQDVF